MSFFAITGNTTTGSIQTGGGLYSMVFIDKDDIKTVFSDNDPEENFISDK